MLVLSRSLGERIVIEHEGKRMTFAIVDVHGDTARIGFEAPPEFKITRDELVDDATLGPRPKPKKTFEALNRPDRFNMGGGV